jgi:hypothetical protein
MATLQLNCCNNWLQTNAEMYFELIFTVVITLKTLLDFFGEAPIEPKDRKKITQESGHGLNNDLSKQFLDEKKRQAAEPLYLERYE